MAARPVHRERDELVTKPKMHDYLAKLSVIPLAWFMLAGYSDADEAAFPGKCEVTFDVTPDGRPEAQSANCSSLEFCSHALKAISKVEFAPLMIDGHAQRRTNITYPLVFALDGQAPDDHETVLPDTELLPCETSNS